MECGEIDIFLAAGTVMRWRIVLMMIGSLAVGIVIFVMLQGGSLGVDDNGGSNCFKCGWCL